MIAKLRKRKQVVVQDANEVIGVAMTLMSMLLNMTHVILKPN